MNTKKWLVGLAFCVMAFPGWHKAFAQDAQKNILLVCKDITALEEEPVAALLAERYNMVLEDQSVLADVKLDTIDAIVISETVDADNTEVLNLIRGGRRPMLNMKGFTYSAGRLDWGEPNSGSVTENGRYVFVERTDHPIFAAYFSDKAQGDAIEVLSAASGKGLMPISVSQQGTYCLAIAFTQDIAEFDADAAPQTILHEIPAAMRGNKYICFPLAQSSAQYLTEDGKLLVNGIMEYLLDKETEDIDLPVLQIYSFEVEGIAAVINQSDNTIELTLTEAEYVSLDSLRAVTPVIELADPLYTHLIPEEGSVLDLNYTIAVPKTFVLTDYISRRSYSFSTHLLRKEGLEETETESAAPVKILRNGMILIQRGQELYTVTGNRIQ